MRSPQGCRTWKALRCDRCPFDGLPLIQKHLLTERLDCRIQSHRIINLEAIMEKGFLNAAETPYGAFRWRCPSVARWCATKLLKRGYHVDIDDNARPAPFPGLLLRIPQTSAYAFLDQRPLELGHRSDDLEHQPTRRRAQVEIFPQADQRHA